MRITIAFAFATVLACAGSPAPQPAGRPPAPSAEPPPDGANCVWHFNRTPAEARAECDGPQWPPGASFPDWFMFGDPHNNYYEGSVCYDDLKLETWTE